MEKRRPQLHLDFIGKWFQENTIKNFKQKLKSHSLQK